MKDMVADLNAKGLDQWSSLHFASDSGHLKIVQELLKQPKIDVEALSTMDRTPLHQACIKGHTEIVKALIEFGANPNCRDFDQCCPLHCASEHG